MLRRPRIGVTLEFEDPMLIPVEHNLCGLGKGGGGCPLFVDGDETGTAAAQAATQTGEEVFGVECRVDRDLSAPDHLDSRGRFDNRAREDDRIACAADRANSRRRGHHAERLAAEQRSVVVGLVGEDEPS